MKTVGIDHVQMEVIDLESTIKFWQDVLGFQVVDRGLRLGLRWVILKDQSNTCLSLHETRTKESHIGPRITHFGIVVEDFEGFRVFLENKQVSVDPINVYDHSRSYYFYDPNHHKVEVSERWGGGL